MLRLEGVKGNGNLRGTAATSLGYIEIQDERGRFYPPLKAPGSSAAAGLGSEDRRGGGLFEALP